MLTDRFVRPEMGAIRTDRALSTFWMEVETAAGAMADEGIVTAETARRAVGRSEVEVRVAARETLTAPVRTPLRTPLPPLVPQRPPPLGPPQVPRSLFRSA